MHYVATQVAEAAARALGKLGAAALPHVHRIVTCATDTVYHCNGSPIFLHGRDGGLRSFADALIELLPHLTSDYASQRLQEVVTQLEEGKRPDVVLCVLAHAGEAALSFKSQIMNILSSYLMDSFTAYHGDQPGWLDSHNDDRRTPMKNVLAALPRQFIRSAEVQAMMKRGLEVTMENMKAKLEDRMEIIEVYRLAGRKACPGALIKACPEDWAERWQGDLEDRMERMKAELEDRMEMMQQATEMEDIRLRRTKAELEAMMEGISAALLEPNPSAAAADRPSSSACSSWHQHISAAAYEVLTVSLIRVMIPSKTSWTLEALMLFAMGSSGIAVRCLMRRFIGGSGI